MYKVIIIHFNAGYTKVEGGETRILRRFDGLNL